MTLHLDSDSGRPHTKLGYQPALDGVRALAIGWVVLSHTIGFPAAGYLGVDIFFVLSGFLITTLLLEEHARHGRVSLRNFYRRRALRLLPALFVLLGVFFAVSVVAVLIRGGSLDRALFGVLAGIGYFTNIAIAAGPPTTTAMPSELVHLWSLAIEEQFYLVWPIVLLLLFRARRRVALIGLGAVVILAAIQQIRLYLDGATWERIGFGSDTRSTSIVVGCALAVALATAARPTIEAIAKKIAPLVVVCFLALLLVVPEPSFFSAWVLVVAVCSVCLILLALDSRSLLARTLSVPPMVFLGRISYSLYLWHLPVYVTMGLTKHAELLDVPALAISLLFATASYYFVEMPFLRRKRKTRLASELRDSSEERDGTTPASRALSTASLEGPDQNTGVSRQTPQTSRSASHISPSVT